jgi:hypothetical protein
MTRATRAAAQPGCGSSVDILAFMAEMVSATLLAFAVL